MVWVVTVTNVYRVHTATAQEAVEVLRDYGEESPKVEWLNTEREEVCDVNGQPHPVT